jgi:K+:H+ antiporter
VNGLQVQALVTRHWDRPGTNDWADVLTTFPLFSGVRKRRLGKLIRHARFSEFAPGDTVVSKDAPADSLYLILGGTARALGMPAARALRTGDYFGELGLLAGARRSATVVATHELHVMRLPAKSFLRLAKRDPGISLTMLRNLGAQFGRLEAQAAQG